MVQGVDNAKSNSIPVCGAEGDPLAKHYTDEAGPYEYRAAIDRSDNSLVLLGSDTGVDGALLMEPTNDHLVQMNSMGYSTCQRIDRYREGQYAFFVRIGKLDPKANDGPWSGGISTCTSSQFVKRAMMAPGAEQGTSRPAFIPANAIPQPDHRNPTADEAQMLAVKAMEFGGSSVCQKRIDNGGDGYGLFLAMSEPVLGEFERMDQSRDLGATMSNRDAMLAMMPADYSQCLPSRANFEMDIGMQQEVFDIQKRCEKDAVLDGKYMDAMALAEDMFRAAGMNPYEDQFEATVENIAFAMSHGMTGEYIRSFFESCYEVYDAAPETLSAFEACICLIVAMNLDMGNSAIGGISKDAKHFLPAIIFSILSGELRVETKRESDAVMYPLAYAYYDPSANVMRFPPQGTQIPISAKMMAIVHEGYHAYQDMRREKLRNREAELQAYAIGVRTVALLSSEIEDPLSDDCIKAMRMGRDYKKFQCEQYAANLDCLEFPDDVVRSQYDDCTAANESIDAWTKIVSLGAVDPERVADPGLFRDYLETFNFMMFNSMALFMNMMLQDGKVQYSQSFVDSGSIQEGYYGAFRNMPFGTPDSGAATSAYLNQFWNVAATAYLTDRAAWQDMIRDFFSRKFDLRSALSASSYVFDGIGDM